MRRVLALVASVSVGLFGAAFAAPAGADVRLSHDAVDPGYVSSYTLATGVPYTDATLQECSRARGRQNEPAVAVDPRNPNVILGSSNDYCGVYNGPTRRITPPRRGRSGSATTAQRAAASSYVSSLVPGYPDDRSPYASLAPDPHGQRR